MSPLLLALLLVAAPGRGRLDAAQRAFADADFEAALKSLEGAAAESRDDATSEAVFLLQGRCHAALGDFAAAERAFELALDANPQASLDASKVDPSVVKLLDALRGRLEGRLVVRAPGAQVSVDGAAKGEAPLELSLPLGPHEVKLAWADGSAGVATVSVRPKRVAQLEGILALPPGVAPPLPAKRLVRPFGDVRGISENGALDGGLELGGGVELPWTRFGLSARLAPSFALTPRLGLVVPALEVLDAFVELEVPFGFRRDGVAVGLGGVLGVEWKPLEVLGVFVQGGGRHFFVNPTSLVPSRWTFGGGVRLRLP